MPPCGSPRGCPRTCAVCLVRRDEAGPVGGRCLPAFRPRIRKRRYSLQAGALIMELFAGCQENRIAGGMLFHQFGTLPFQAGGIAAQDSEERERLFASRFLCGLCADFCDRCECLSGQHEQGRVCTGGTVERNLDGVCPACGADLPDVEQDRTGVF